jgi:salicylate hydroxylase
VHSFLILNRTCPVVQPWIYGYDAIAEAETVLQGKESPNIDGKPLPEIEAIKGKF